MDKNEIAFNNKKLFNIQVPSHLYTGSLNDNCKYISKTNSKILHMKDDYCGIKLIFFRGGGEQYSYSLKKKYGSKGCNYRRNIYLYLQMLISVIGIDMNF